MGGKRRYQPQPIKDDRANKIAIVFDGSKWHVRRVYTITHSVAHDGKIYYCNKSIVNDAKTLREAVSGIPTSEISVEILESVVEFISDPNEA